MTTEPEKFSEHVKKVRKKLNLSQEDLAHAIGVSFATVNLNNRQGKALGFMREHKKLTIQDFEKLCSDVNRRSLQRDLKGMLDKALIASEGV